MRGRGVRGAEGWILEDAFGVGADGGVEREGFGWDSAGKKAFEVVLGSVFVSAKGVIGPGVGGIGGFSFFVFG